MSDQKSDAAPKGPKIQIQMDDATAMGKYSNLVLMNHTENEFVLDFAFIQPGTNRAKVIARVINSPKHTKRLLKALEHNIRLYEQRFGEIDIANPEEPIVH
jgi:hypothetical protein